MTYLNQLWEKRVINPDLNILDYKQEGNIRKFLLIAEPVKHKIIEEITLDAKGYNGTTPGPLIIMKEGDYIYLTVENRLNEPTSLHVHGLSKPNPEDGVPDINPFTPTIYPGESYTYKFLCWQSGTFFYHSSDPKQIAQGMLGSFIVLPKNPQTIPYNDFVLLMQEWEIEQPELGKIKEGIYKPMNFNRNPNFFTINGKAFPSTTPLIIEENERIRLRFITKSSMAHSMHLHGHNFQIVAVDGFFKKGEFDDTVNLASGKRIEVEFTANNPGIWPLNGTKTFHQTNNGVTPGGMVTKVIYKKFI